MLVLRYYSEQALIRIWAWGVGPHIVLNRGRVGVAIILNDPFSFFLFVSLVGYLHPTNPFIWPHCASFVALVLV